MDKDTVKEILNDIEAEGIAALHSEGYAWVKENFTPYLLLAEDLLPEESELLADCWYLMGDLHDFNAAPLKAIEAYQKAIEIDEEIEGAYRELASMYEQVGNYPEALKYINLALEKLPDEEELMDEKQMIQDSINYTTEPHLTENNLVWKLSEKIANGSFDAVIEAVSQIKEPEVALLLSLARAYGAKNEEALYMQTWQKILDSKEDLELHYADWFYMPISIYTDEKIWKLIKELAPQVELATFIYFDSLYEFYGEELSEGELLSLICDFQIHLANSDISSVEVLAKKYPKWEEVQMM